MNLTTTQRGFLFEAYRRNDMANADPTWKGRPITARWLGLGTAAAYRPMLDDGLMVFHDGRTPPRGCMGWLCLTPKGVKAMSLLNDIFAPALKSLKADPSYADSVGARFTLAGGYTAGKEVVDATGV